ncbi:MAG: CehA/McbA family metallohydrolase [Phenylobacterium sp.]|uniref:CehA/McbA family metallohydrolase n=1 Tax=Phenylobacterium sp. TaxID=1871053 RepID=UPI00391D6E3C
MRSLMILLAWLWALAPLAAEAREPDAVIAGQISRADHQTYRELTFQVPPGVRRLTVEFDYEGRDQKTVIDLGLLGPDGFRGWSGGTRRGFTVSAEEASPGYLPGPISPGRWAVLIGVPNIREGQGARYEARVFLDRQGPAAGFADAPLKDGPAWYRGDLHMHTAHSDGACLSQSGAKVPCPVYRTVEAAAARGLDFIAITDHNTTSQFEAMRELQPAFDRLLLIPGREITTFQGHANVFGPTGYIDFRLGEGGGLAARDLQDAVERAGGLLSINHPGLPSGELCMGCGWTASDVDYDRVQAVEVVNGGTIASTRSAEGPLQGIAFWQARLNEGHRITAIGGSDNHDAGLGLERPGAIGRPTTVVHARALSTPDLLAAIRAGRVFIDVQGSGERRLDLSARAGGAGAVMGGDLAAPAGERVRLAVEVADVPGGRVELIVDGARDAALSAALSMEAHQTLAFDLAGDGARHWVRADVRDAQGRLVLIGNPIYLNWPKPLGG